MIIASKDQSWATVTTLRETPEATLNFAAHHLLLGASEIWLYFDDPNDPAIQLVADQKTIRAIVCDDTYWQAKGYQRPDTHQMRQKINAQDAYTNTECDWIMHLDADEFVNSSQSISEMLDQASSDVLRLPPFEMLQFKQVGIGEDFTHFFRGALPNTAQGRRISDKAYGEFSTILPSGMLSHVAGKFFVKTRVENVTLSIHGPFIDGKRHNGENAPATLLHLHGGNYEEWRSRVIYRMEKGAYWPGHQRRVLKNQGVQSTLGGSLAALYESEGEEGLKRFHKTTCQFDHNKRALRRVGSLLEANLSLDKKREEAFGSTGMKKYTS